MTSVIHDLYGMSLASSGKLKLRAKALLAEGTAEEVFDACVLLHEAARIERLAVEALPVCPPTTLLASLTEECWCYVEGRDPLRAAATWGHILRASEGVDTKAVEAILSRLAPRFEASQLEFERAVSAAPFMRALDETGRIDGPLAPDRAKAREDLSRLLLRFPGTEKLWWLKFRLADAAGDKPGAWDALTRAQQLRPDDPRVRAVSLLVAAWALRPAEAEKHLAGARGSLDRAEAVVCLMYAAAELALAQKASSSREKKARWVRARDAAEAGRARADTPWLRSHLKAMQLLLSALLEGREPTVDILYRCGLGEIAAMVKATANVADVLTVRLRRGGLDQERDEAA